jgi:anthranilate phosphoribosyltransferase
VLKTLTEQLRGLHSLSPVQVVEAVQSLTDETVSAEEKAEFLSALAKKGETIEEITSFARELRDKSIQPPLTSGLRDGEILDVCGTGGDRLGTFNISTTVAILAASAGVRVAKHGNRAITSQAGSADVLEELGIPIDLGPEEAVQCLARLNFAFFFAQKYHPAFKHIGPARKLCADRGERTIFNFLGPLLNPARPTAQLLGVPQPHLCEPVAKVLQSLGLHRAMVVCGSASPVGAGAASWLDELSTLGENHVAEFYQEQGFSTSTFSPTHLPLQPVTLEDLTGGDRKTNAAILRQILNGDERGPKRDAVLLNAGAALFVAGKCDSILDGWELAGNLIDSGKASAKLKELAE